jgi:sugar phosphate isomerase/epimerase
MKLGFLTSNIEDIVKAKQFGFDAVELDATALGDPTAGAMEERVIEHVAQTCAETGVKISALAYYGAAWQTPAPDNFTRTYQNVFAAANKLGVTVIASMTGFDSSIDWNANVKLFSERFAPVAAAAETSGIKVAFENWMGFWGRPPFRPVNFGGSPDTWDALFAAVPSEAIGIEFDPSHLYWQGIDHVRALKEYASRVYHVHAKDTEMLPEKRYRGGFNGDYFRFRIPGYGEINWAAFVSALDEIDYRGGIAIEHEDPIYVDARFDEGLARGWQTLYPLVHPSAGSFRIDGGA